MVIIINIIITKGIGDTEPEYQIVIQHVWHLDGCFNQEGGILVDYKDTEIGSQFLRPEAQIYYAFQHD